MKNILYGESGGMGMMSVLLGAIAVVLGAVNAVWAADRTWANTGTDYNAGASWGGTAPGVSDAAVFNAAAVTQPNLSASLANQQVRFSVAAASGYTLGANPGASLTLTSTGSSTNPVTGAALVGQHTSGINTITAPIILGAAAGSTQRVHMSGAGTFVLSGGISQVNSPITLQLDLAASSVIRLSGNNTFTGGLTYNTSGSSSVLELGSDTAIPASGTFTLSSTQARTIRPSGATLRTVANPCAINTAGVLTFGRDSGFSGGATVFTGATTLGANSVVFAGTGDAVVFEGSIGETGGNRNFTQNSGGGVGSTQGSVFLMGANTWTGTTTLNQGGNGGTTFTVAKYLASSGTADSLGANAGANSTVAVPGGSGAGSVVRYIGGQTTSDRTWNWGLTTSSGALPMSFDATGSGALTLNGSLNPLGLAGTKRTATLTFDGISTANNTFAGVIANPTATADSTTAVTKSGLGTWVLTGANTSTGGITVASGKLVLDYTSNSTVVNSANAVTLLGGTLEFKAHPTAATAQTLGNVTLEGKDLTPYGASKLVFTRPGVGTLAVTFGTFSKTAWSGNGQNALFIDNTAGATVAGSATLDDGILPWAVIKDSMDTGFLTTSGANLVRYTSATALADNSNAATTNYKLSGTLALTAGNKEYNSLAVDTTGGGTLTVNTGISINPHSLLFTGTGNYTVTGGQVLLGVTGDNYIQQYSSGMVTISSGVGNGTTSGKTLTKTGPGTIELSGTKDANGKIVILEGALRASNSSVLDPATFAAGMYISLGGGVVELGVGNFSGTIGTAAGNVRWLGDGGFSAYGADRTVSLNSGVSITWGSANFVRANNALVLGGRDANAMIDFQNGLDFGFQQRVVRVMNGSAAVDARLSGALTGNYGGGLIKDGAGTLELTAANSYLGETWVREGTLLVDNTSGSGTGSGTVTVQGGAVLGGTGAVSGNVTYQSGAAGLFSKTTGSADTPLAITGTLILNNNAVTVNVLGSALGAGTYTLVTTTAGITGDPAATPTITGMGLIAGAVASVAKDGNNLKLTVTAETPTKLVITSVNGGLNPDEDTPFYVVVQAQDAGGTPRVVLQNTDVELSVKTGSGTLGGTKVGTILAGQHTLTISGATYDRADTGVVLTATRTGGDVLTAGDSAAFNVISLVPTKLAIVSVNGGASPNRNAPFDVVVQARNDAGAPRVVTQDTAVALSVKTGTGSLGGTTVGTIPNGQHTLTISGVTYDAAQAGVVLTATRTSGESLAAGDSASFEVLIAVPHHFAISTISSPQAAGTPITGITITAQDSGNSTLPDFEGTVTYGGTAGITGTSGNFTAGVLSGVSVTPTNAGSGLTFTVEASGKTGTCTFDVNPGPIAHYTVSAGNVQIQGVPFTVTVTAKDTYNHTVTSDSSTAVTMASGGGGLFDGDGDSTFGEAGDNIKTLLAGSFTIAARDGTMETLVITASDGNAKTGSSLPISVSVAPSAGNRYWDPGQTLGTAVGGSGEWNTTSNFWWNGSINTTWAPGSNAIFAGTAGTVVLGGNSTAGDVQFNTPGYVLAFGTNIAKSLTVTSLSGSALSNATFIGSSTAPSGTFNIQLNHGVNEVTFNGTIADNGLGSQSSFYWTSSGRLILAPGFNHTAALPFDIRGAGTLRLATTSGLPDFDIRGSAILELAAGDLSRNFGMDGGMRLRESTTNGFAAIGADRTLTMANGSDDVKWQTANFENNSDDIRPAVLVLGTADSTHKLTLTHATAGKGLRLQNSSASNPAGTTTREIRTGDGAAAVEAEIAMPLMDSTLADRLGAIVKTGNGALALSGASTYSGGTVVSNGTLLVNNTSGSGTGSGAVTVANGAAIAGTGTVGGNLTLESGGKFSSFDTGSGVPSKLTISGAFDIGAGVLDLSGLETVGHRYYVLAECGSVVGQFSNVINPMGWAFVYSDTQITLIGVSGSVFKIR
jgi:fibronectin-binding autotransporter adhesin